MPLQVGNRRRVWRRRRSVCRSLGGSVGRSKSPGFVVAALLAACAFLACSCGGEEADDSSARIEPGQKWYNPGGRWHHKAGPRLTEEQSEEIEKLKSIGYLAGSEEPPPEAGVTVYDRERAYDGLNFYTSGHLPGAILMDMDGDVLHEWRYDFIDAWKQGPRDSLPKRAKGAGFWRRAYLFENGDVLGIYDGLGLVKVDSESELIWAYLEGAHHDLDVQPDGRIYVVIRDAHINPTVNPDDPVLEDYIVVLDEDGRELRRTPLLEAFRTPRYSRYLDVMKESGDIFHTNTIEVLDSTLEGEVAGFEEGNILVCVRELDVAAVVDDETGKVVWAARAPWSKPHDTTVLPNGNMMIFDNRGYGGASRVVEFDPKTLEIVWDYHGEDPLDFYSKECGANQRLPNGNTLLTESDGGRALEVTPEGEIVWEYVNPAHAGPDSEFIASIFDMVRLEPDFPLDWLEENGTVHSHQ
ncbi:MAG: PQQ-binding-like beta-propeller repeat protein [Candidatus Eisenbacteria bacterium]|nr:PQQ-binding-like beta-propeller repeat protein [Candidatus Eisenbacteria bacterium]